MIRLVGLYLFCSAALAVETKPVPVLRVIDGDTIEVQADLGGQLLPVSVRLLYVDTPESRDNSHDKAMPEGKAAAAWLKERLAGAVVVLWGPGEKLESDANGRVLANPEVVTKEWVGEEGDKLIYLRSSLAHDIVRHGHSVYWRKYGDAPGEMHGTLLTDEANAEDTKQGAWATAPQWMQDKANERTAPKREKP